MMRAFLSITSEEGQQALKTKYEEDLEELKRLVPDSPELWSGVYRRKTNCSHCGKVFYRISIRMQYCSYRCKIGAYIKRRKARLEARRKNKICIFCNKLFSPKRSDAKYCCESHRVRACLARKAALPRWSRWSNDKQAGLWCAKCSNQGDVCSPQVPKRTQKSWLYS